MEGKFKTTIDDFISKRFKEILCIDYQKVELYFVSNIDPYKRDIGLTLEMLMSKKYHYRNKKYMINPFMPIPKIKSCY
ncbi:MAG: hypothetical protein B6226_01010 [Candidatus Cloacimonetes bacterium 4572_65]|nr:MAG: hypothetical protein B6226_01010 [Candidatus Cloacimonetes bacterium 4572_65]